jgi:hypothetical protein
MYVWMNNARLMQTFVKLQAFWQEIDKILSRFCLNRQEIMTSTSRLSPNRGELDYPPSLM